MVEFKTNTDIYSVCPELSCFKRPYQSSSGVMLFLQEPKSFVEAVQHSKCREAMDRELQALETNCTWILTTFPTGKKVIGCKWVYKMKLKADGSVERYKACLVAKGYNQVEGIDYIESFSLVAKAVTVRIFIAIAAAHAWPIQQLDINNAFLHGRLDEDVYMLPPDGYPVHQKNLQAYGFKQSENDHCLFTMFVDSAQLSLLVYVDDILITGPSLSTIQNVKDYLHALFTIQDLGDIRYFLGLEIARNPSGTYIAQTKYVLDIIKHTKLLHSKSVSTPFPQGLKLSVDCGAKIEQPDAYRRLVGRLLYLSFTRPDIFHCVQQLSQFLNHPCEDHWTASLHVVKYLKGCASKGIFLPSGNDFVLTAYRDVDWASCTDSRRSLTGFCILLGFGVPVALRVLLYCDNKATLYIIANPVFHERTKHIEFDCHVVRDAYKSGFVAPSPIRGVDQLADIFTKVLPLKSFCALMSKLGLVSFLQVPLAGWWGGGGWGVWVEYSHVDAADQDSDASIQALADNFMTHPLRFGSFDYK
ncbi:UNVERIFIED_CONTAM: Retrovirus-related Pol polyprotein from transposon RE2 [Sesamum latifolium]|uniref:Retrovirus-related Pol polyprotein from transposon RE2 n=1 Tax=Sesamum latifolium TaxID=2727402 RepID=A0AAW2X1L0_9LAMI